MPAVSGQVIRKVVQICKDTGVPSKITPGLFDILRGAARVVNVREIQLEDLLRREVRNRIRMPCVPQFRGRACW